MRKPGGRVVVGCVALIPPKLVTYRGSHWCMVFQRVMDDRHMGLRIDFNFDVLCPIQ